LAIARQRVVESRRQRGLITERAAGRLGLL
ncbi:DJ-1/PfpI family protein, partial [Pseudomonas gingeri]|nr:DJ-1/PfpI family protein [Pseudomonas gingeri]